MKTYERKKIVKALCLRYFIMTVICMIVAALAIYAAITYGPTAIDFLSQYNPFIPGLRKFNIATIVVAIGLIGAALLIFTSDD